MIKRKHVLVLALTFCLTLTLFIAVSTGYDPWVDLDDDGDIDADDLYLLANEYGTSGKPINKTELLLELVTRLNSLNASLLADYYNITDCDSLFALLSHLHSGSDISGGTLEIDQIRLGSSEANHIIYFYEDGSQFGEFIYWHNTGDRFFVSDDTYIEGDIQIGGTINIPTTTRYYSIPAIAWLPYSDNIDFIKMQNVLYTTTYSAGATVWYTPVNLPHGAVVTEFTAWVKDFDVANIDVCLQRQEGVSIYEMSSVSSSGSSPGIVPYTNSSIDYATIDNQNCAYYVYGILRSGDINHCLSQVRITYTITEPLP